MKKVNGMNKRRIACLSVEPEILGIILSMNTTLVVETDLPLDAKLVSCDKDVMNNKLNFIYESKKFDWVTEGEVVPVLSWDTVRFIDEGMSELIDEVMGRE